MTISHIVGASIVSLVLATAACGPHEEAKTVTNTETTQSNPNGSQTKTQTSDTQTDMSDGSRDTSHSTQVNQKPPAK